MRFGMVGQMGPEMRQIDGFGDRSTREGIILGANVGHPVVTNAEFVAKVHCARQPLVDLPPLVATRPAPKLL